MMSKYLVNMNSFEGVSNFTKNARLVEIEKIHEEMKDIEKQRVAAIAEANAFIDNQIKKKAELICDNFWTYEVAGRKIYLFTSKKHAESFMPRVLKQLEMAKKYNRKLKAEDCVINIIQCTYRDTYENSWRGDFPCIESWGSFPNLGDIDKDPSRPIANYCWGGATAIEGEDYTISK